MAKKTPVAILGSTGYTGGELVRLLVNHPRVEIAALTSRQYADQPYSNSFPQFTGIVDTKCEELDANAIAKRVPFAFSCLPAGDAAPVVAKLIKAGVKVVDLSADFRFKVLDTYVSAYGVHKAPELATTAVYGLPELHRDEIKNANLVAGPGCYPTATILGLAPIMKNKLNEAAAPIIADCKSGASGAGRAANLGTHFVEVNEGLHAYKVLEHRHQPEIEQEVSLLAGVATEVEFVPHLIPMNRGILATIYVTLKKESTTEALLKTYSDFYKDEAFVHVRSEKINGLPDVSDVRMTNNCHIGVTVKGTRAVITSVIDNLTKGASGQLVQCMNIMQGWEENISLE